MPWVKLPLVGLLWVNLKLHRVRIRLSRVNLTRVQLPRVEIKLPKVNLILVDINSWGKVFLCRDTRDKFNQGIVTWGKDKVTLDELCGLFHFMYCIHKNSCYKRYYLTLLIVYDFSSQFCVVLNLRVLGVKICLQ